MVDSPANLPVGDNSAPGGSGNPDDIKVKDTVSYDTHKKLLDEKKKLADKVALFESDKTERERKELESKGEYQKLIELEKKRADDAVAKVAEFDARMVQAKKLKALLGAVGGEVDEKFYDFLPIDQIVIDPETKEINLTSVAQVAEGFKKQFPELLKKPNGPRLPNGAPQGSDAGTIARAEWMKLSSKEMLKYKPSQITGS